MDYGKLGYRIHYYRKQQHLTQEQLAEFAGISLSFLGHVERGTRKASLETIVAICNALTVSPQSLLQDSLSDEINNLPLGEKPRKAALLREVSTLLDHYYDEE